MFRNPARLVAVAIGLFLSTSCLSQRATVAAGWPGVGPPGRFDERFAAGFPDLLSLIDKDPQLRRLVRRGQPSHLLHLRPGRVVELGLGSIVKYLGLRDGMKVADIGCGPGAFSFHLARAIGPTGTLFAVDFDAEALEIVKRFSKMPAINPYRNVVAVRDTPTDVALGPNTLDLAFMAQVHFFHPPDDAAAGAMIASIYRALKPGGRVLVVEPRCNEKTTVAGIRARFEAAGLRTVRATESWRSAAPFLLCFEKR